MSNVIHCYTIPKSIFYIWHDNFLVKNDGKLYPITSVGLIYIISMFPHLLC